MVYSHDQRIATGNSRLNDINALTPLLANDDEGFVFKGTVEGKALVGIPKLWKKMLKDHGPRGVTPHVLRHSSFRALRTTWASQKRRSAP